MRSEATTRLAAIGLAAVLAAGCGGPGTAEAEPGVTVAFLRAVGGVASTEPSFLSTLRSAGTRKLTPVSRPPGESSSSTSPVAIGSVDRKSTSTSGAVSAATRAPLLERATIRSTPS